MDNQNRSITLYSVQPDGIVDSLQKGIPYYAKLAYIKEKYGEVATVFLNAYRWYTEAAENIVFRPVEAESAVWAYQNLRMLEKHAGYSILKLSVPLDQVVFFRMCDWNKILNFRYVGQNEQEEAAFQQQLIRTGIQYEGEIYRTSFYPLLKKELVKSWQNLFRFHQAILEGTARNMLDIQAGLWHINPEWIASIVNE